MIVDEEHQKESGQVNGSLTRLQIEWEIHLLSRQSVEQT